MNTSAPDRATEDEIERLRQALDLEIQQRLDVQKRLERGNADFEEFISTTSHKLRESLRMVGSYSQLLAETCAGRLDPEADVFLSHIHDGVGRMQSLLTDVVEYWTPDSGDRNSSPTDMEAVLSQALLSTGKQIEESNAVVTHDPLPVVLGDFDLLTKVLQHLIGNSIKFRGAAPPTVHISSKRQDLEWVFSVKDSGPGIEPQFRDSIFRAFKRLHGQEYAGNGLGLAFCKKAIEWHGGRIWLESTPGAGSTFYFTLPHAD